MKKLLFLGFALLLTTSAFSQVGIGTTNPNASSILDLTATNKGLLLPRVANTAAITATPVNGLMIYDISNNCVRAYENGAWSNCLNGTAAINPSTGGTGVVSAYVCSTASAGTMTVGTAVSGVTQTITATVTTVGTYSITATANGVTFSGAGTFAGTGSRAIVLTATGTPTAAGTFSYALSTTPGCSFDRAAVAAPVVPTITSTTGKIWMDRNLGATQVATSATDHLAYGDLYQWGRKADGHQVINWTSSTAGTPANGTTTANADVPANALFIIETVSPYDWRVTPNDNLWNGVAAVNNPCPAGFRVPTSPEITAEVTAYSITNSATAFSSTFKFTVPGYRDYSTGALNAVGSYGYYWSSSLSGTLATYRYFISGGTNVDNNARANGFTVRCLKD